MFPKNGLENLDVLANLLQIASFLLLTNEASNNKLLEELQNQNKTYLDKAIKQNEIIIAQNKEIIERLERIENVRFEESRRNI